VRQAGSRRRARSAEQGGFMKSAKHPQISASAALRLVDLIQEQAKLTECESAKKILLRAGIKIADLALRGETPARRMGRAA